MRTTVARTLVACALCGCGGIAPEVPGSEADSLAPALAPPVFVEAVPEDPTAQIEFAFARHDAGDYALAAEVFLQAAEAFPAAESLAARSMAEEGRLAEAYAHAVSATRRCARNPVSLFVLGLVAARDGRRDEAREAYEQVLELDPDHAAAHNNLGGLFYLDEAFDRARAATEAALAAADDDESRSVATANLAELDALDGRLDLAEAGLDAALAMAPDHAHGYFSLAALYDVTGRPDAARTMVEHGLALDPFGATQRSYEFVWPELGLHFEALVAEGRADFAVARALWSRLAELEAAGELRWAPLAGRAAAHLADLDGAPIARLPTIERAPIAVR